MAQFYYFFIQDFGFIMEPKTKMLKILKPFVWTNECHIGNK